MDWIGFGQQKNWTYVQLCAEPTRPPETQEPETRSGNVRVSLAAEWPRWRDFRHVFPSITPLLLATQQCCNVECRQRFLLLPKGAIGEITITALVGIIF